MPTSTSSSRPAAGRRVVVTGIGAVSPNGVGREAFWEATRSGRSGVHAIDEFDPGDLPVRIAAIDEFDPGDLPVRIAGTVRGFEPSRYLPENDLKHVARAVPMALAAAEEALLDSGLGIEPWPLEERRRTAVVLGTGGAGLEFIERQFRQYYLRTPAG